MKKYADERAIWKFELDRGLTTKLCVPKGSKILSVARQKKEDVIYLEVDPEEMYTVECIIYGVPTGMLVDLTDLRFIGTVVGEDSLVFHYYSKEILPVSPAKET